MSREDRTDDATARHEALDERFGAAVMRYEPDDFEALPETFDRRHREPPPMGLIMGVPLGLILGVGVSAAAWGIARGVLACIGGHP